MKPCLHGMPTPKACWECMEEGNLPTPEVKAPPKVVSPYPIKAKYDSMCFICGDEMMMGMLIVKLDNGKWVHDNPCAIDLDRADDV